MPLFFILVFISGLLISLSFFKAEDGSGVYFQKGLISSIFTGLISLCLLFAATSKLLFSHLWKKIPLMIGIECIVKIIQWKKKKPLRKKFVKNKKFACGYLQNLSWLKMNIVCAESVFKGEEIFNEFGDCTVIPDKKIKNHDLKEPTL